MASPRRTTLDPEQAAMRGMRVAIHAREHPERLALASPYGDWTFDELNRAANQLARALRARGLREGDAVALLCANRPEFAIVACAALRAGLRLTPIHTELRTPEIRYIIDDCEAKALIADGRFAQAAADAVRSVPRAAVRIGVGDPVHGFEPWETALAAESEDDLEDPVLGSQMPYTSGTTGRPKGVYRPPQAALAQPGLAAAAARLEYRPGRDLHLCTGPLHHAAPFVFSLAMPLDRGCAVVLMDGFDPLHALDLIAGYRVTHTHMVPVMFRRLLALPAEDRLSRDLSSLRVVLHGAAPCPVDVKQRMIEWLGPVLYEYYAATEGWGTFCDTPEWLAHPGTVGRPAPGTVEIRDLEGKVQPPGREGVIYLRMPEGAAFEYFKDEPKTRAARAGAFFTLGDIGVLDEHGYLYLRDRSADVINSGGANVYPAEVDAALVQHPAVADVATVGVPDEEWGERVVAVVELADGYVPSDTLAEELIASCSHSLAAYKCPTRVVFEEHLPRLENGKIYRRLVRERQRAA